MRRYLLLVFVITACKSESPKPHAVAARAIVKIVAARPHIAANAKPSVDDVEIAPGIFGVPDNGMYRLSTMEHDSSEPVIEGAISARSMLHDHRDLVAVLQPGIMASNDERAACKTAWLERGGQLETRYEWIVAFRFVGDGVTMRVTEIHTLADHWPKTFDEEIKRCYLASFSRMQFPSTLVTDTLVEHPLCMNPIERK